VVVVSLQATVAATTTLMPGVPLDRHLMVANLIPAAKCASKSGTRLPIAGTATMKSLYLIYNRLAGVASASTNDPNWYLDSGATDHITGELEKLTMHETYHNNDQIRVANGAGMDITHVGKAVLPDPFILITSCTYPIPINNLFLFIGSILITILSLSYILFFP
jgi:hypothetical protein